MKHLFFRCIDGHFFRRESCPFDGWSYPGIAAAEEAFSKSRTIDLDQLAKLAGCDEFLRTRMLLIESDVLPETLEGMNLTELVYETGATDAVGEAWPRA